MMNTTTAAAKIGLYIQNAADLLGYDGLSCTELDGGKVRVDFFTGAYTDGRAGHHVGAVHVTATVAPDGAVAVYARGVYSGHVHTGATLADFGIFLG